MNEPRVPDRVPWDRHSVIESEEIAEYIARVMPFKGYPEKRVTLKEEST